MNRLFSMALAAALTFVFATSSFAQPGVSNVSPAQGTVGTQITITGAELGTSAPKAFLQLHGDATAKPIPLKLVKPFDGVTIHAVVAKIMPGGYDLVVTPKGGSAITVVGAFTARAPQISGLSATTVAPGDSLDISGSFFGTVKGKVAIGGVAAKVALWSDGKITVVVSKQTKSAVGAAIDVVGKGGTLNAGATVAVVAPITGKDHFTAQLDHGGGTLNVTAAGAAYATSINGLRFDLKASRLSGLTGTSLFTIDITVLADLQVATYTGGQTTIGVTYTVIAPQSTGYSALNAAPWTVTVTQRSGGRITGTFSGGLAKNFTSLPGPATYGVTGDFTLTLK